MSDFEPILDEARRWLDGFERLARSTASQRHLPQILEALDTSRLKLNEP